MVNMVENGLTRENNPTGKNGLKKLQPAKVFLLHKMVQTGSKWCY